MDEGKAGASRRRRGRAWPGLEALEGRRLMAAKVAQVGFQEDASSGTPTLYITGTNKADVIKIDDSGTGAAGNIVVTLGTGRVYTTQSAVAVVEVQGNGGDDQVSYNLDGNLVASRAVLVDLGAGNDRFTANLAGSIADAGGLDLEAYGGAGNDTLSVNQSGATLAGQAVSYLDGGAGNDNLSYIGTGAVAAGASVTPEFSGGAGNDVINSKYAGVIAGNYIYNLTADGGAGNDVINDDIAVLAGSTGTVGSSSGTPAAVTGGAGNDKIHFAVTVDPAAAQAQVYAVAVGGAGKDTVQRSANVSGDPSNEKDSALA